jgi:hypothetical protein
MVEAELLVTICSSLPSQSPQIFAFKEIIHLLFPGVSHVFLCCFGRYWSSFEDQSTVGVKEELMTLLGR